MLLLVIHSERQRLQYGFYAGHPCSLVACPGGYLDCTKSFCMSQPPLNAGILDERGWWFGLWQFSRIAYDIGCRTRETLGRGKIATLISYLIEAFKAGLTGSPNPNHHEVFELKFRQSRDCFVCYQQVDVGFWDSDSETEEV